jgi:xanthine/uracil/vitamin C permease (AzgA family)
VLASVLAVCIALTWSISATFWCGFAAYCLALLAYRRAALGVHG